MARDTDRRNIAIPKPDIAELEAIADQRGLSLPDIVREAIRDYLTRQKKGRAK
jgi:hypothetical protein